MTEYSVIESLKHAEDYAEIDQHFAAFVTRLEQAEIPELTLAAAMVSRAIRDGDICVDLQTLVDETIVFNDDESYTFPDLELLRKTLLETKSVGEPGYLMPLILDSKNRLYLYRYWEYENILAKKIQELSQSENSDFDSTSTGNILKRLFDISPDDDFNYQELATFTASQKDICIITGGPGTGKTYTVARVLALLLEKERNLKIALCAPTGKAAARLSESISKSVDGLSCDDTLKELIPRQASTIHRLLGTIRNSPYFRHNPGNRLPHDIVIVDEVSMVDLPLMSKLLQALNDNAKLILIGDKDQLASVEAGAVLGDICAIAESHTRTEFFNDLYYRTSGKNIPDSKIVKAQSQLCDCIVELKRSYRFDDSTGIGVLSRAVNNGDISRSLDIFKTGNYDDLFWGDLPRRENLPAKLRDIALEGYAEYLKTNDPANALSLFNNFMVLGALRDGPYGIENLNRIIENILQNAGLIDTRARWYRGRPVMITRNDYGLELYNGDIGITLPDDVDPDKLKVYFPGQGNAPRKISPIRLPAHETVYAMTVHKSQGSEFKSTLLILPDTKSPVLTRELFYTGITRAKKTLQIWSKPDITEYTISRALTRASGLTDYLI